MFNILVVEDEAPMQKFITKTLEEKIENLNIFVSTTGKEALKIASKKKIDVFIIDIGLPGYLNGVYLSKKLRECSYHDTPIIIETRFDDLETEAEVFSEVHNLAYLVKPFSEELLIRQVNVALKMIETPKKEILALDNGSNVFKFDMDAILYIQKVKLSKNIDIVIFDPAQNKPVPINIKRLNLEDVLAQMGEKATLCRCNNSYIINYKKIERIDDKNDLIYIIHIKDAIPIGNHFQKNRNI